MRCTTWNVWKNDMKLYIALHLPSALSWLFIFTYFNHLQIVCWGIKWHTNTSCRLAIFVNLWHAVKWRKMKRRHIDTVFQRTLTLPPHICFFFSSRPFQKLNVFSRLFFHFLLFFPISFFSYSMLPDIFHSTYTRHTWLKHADTFMGMAVKPTAVSVCLASSIDI